MPSTDNKPNIRTVKCPSCGKTVPWTEDSPHRPFCSEHCQLLDFGDWAAERHAIPVSSPDNLSFPDPEDEV